MKSIKVAWVVSLVVSAMASLLVSGTIFRGTGSLLAVNWRVFVVAVSLTVFAMAGVWWGRSLTGVEILALRMKLASADDIWRLKQHAREIKTRWPSSTFVRYPLRHESWGASAGQELRTAQDWYDRFEQVFSFESDWNDPRWTTLDFDGVMCYLDIQERKRRGLAVEDRLERFPTKAHHP